MKWDLLTCPHAGHLTKLFKGLICLLPGAYNFCLCLCLDSFFFGAALRMVPLSNPNGASLPFSSSCWRNSSNRRSSWHSLWLCSCPGKAILGRSCESVGICGRATLMVPPSTDDNTGFFQAPKSANDMLSGEKIWRWVLKSWILFGGFYWIFLPAWLDTRDHHVRKHVIMIFN